MNRRGAESDDTQVRTNATVAGVILGLVFTFVGGLLAELWGLDGIALLLTALAIGVACGVAVRVISLHVARGFSAGIAAFLFPRGESVPYEPTFSAHDALEAKGDVAGAIAAYDATLAREPMNLIALRQAAELHVRAANPTRAAELLAQLRRVAGDARDSELYATQRLADLYLGALGDEGRAMVELRRLSERFPGTREAQGARLALQRLKRELPPGTDG